MNASAPATIRIYFDTNLVCRIRDERLRAADARALEQLAEFAGRPRYVTSDLLTNEVAQTVDARGRGVLLFLSAVVEKVPWEATEFSGCIGGGPIGATPLGGDWIDPIYDGLQNIFDRADAHHVFLAVRGRCDYFLTLDRSSILSRATERAPEIARLCGAMKLVDPPALVDFLFFRLKPP